MTWQARSRIPRCGAVCAFLFAVGSLPFAAGCGKKEPEPNVPGYYTGPIKPKGEVAPGPAGAARPGARGGAATGR